MSPELLNIDKQPENIVQNILHSHRREVWLDYLVGCYSPEKQSYLQLQIWLTFTHTLGHQTTDWGRRSVFVHLAGVL